jgi:hypothetical protein
VIDSVWDHNQARLGDADPYDPPTLPDFDKCSECGDACEPEAQWCPRCDKRYHDALEYARTIDAGGQL